MAQNAGEQVVEVVGHAVRQLGEPLGTLQLPHPLLPLGPVGNGLAAPAPPGEAPRAGGPRHCRVLDPAVLAVGTPQTVLRRVAPLSGHPLAPRPPRPPPAPGGAPARAPP